MNTEQTDLARRLVACDQWRYQPRMAIKTRDHEAIAIDEHHTILELEYHPKDDIWAASTDLVVDEWMDTHEGGFWFQLSVIEGRLEDGSWVLPCLSDYATAAILLRMACEQCGAHAMGAWFYDGPPPDLGTAAAKALLAIWEQ